MPATRSSTVPASLVYCLQRCACQPLIACPTLRSPSRGRVEHHRGCTLNTKQSLRLPLPHPLCRLRGAAHPSQHHWLCGPVWLRPARAGSHNGHHSQRRHHRRDRCMGGAVGWSSAGQGGREEGEGGSQMDRLARVSRPAEGISMLHSVALVLLSRGTQQPCQCLTLRSNHRSRLPPPTAPFRQHGVVCTHACWGTKVSRAVAQPAAGGHTHNLRHPLSSQHPGAAASPCWPPACFTAPLPVAEGRPSLQWRRVASSGHRQLA